MGAGWPQPTMTVAYDDKGKVFSNIISKDALSVRIQTVTNMITGEIYVDHDKRVKDELEFAGQFIAVTTAKVFNGDGSLAYTAEFVTVNRNHIVWLALEDGPQH